MADFTKLIAEANAAEETVVPAKSDSRRKPRNIESLDARREPQLEAVREPPKEQPVDEKSEAPPPPELFQSSTEDPWTNFTTRLRKSTKERLQTLCLQRQIQKAKPWGQQDLVEEAMVMIINKYSQS